jgi:cyclic dehypoxanthinyl futalosine synthase
MSVRQVLERLTRAGLQGLPGGGGENLEPEVRMAVSPLKQSGFGWIETLRIAQELGLVTSATQVIGFGEPLEARVDHLLRLRALQDDARSSHGNGFTSFIHWPMQFENTGLKRMRLRREEPVRPSPAEEYLRHLGVARLVLDNFDHFQASWPTVGAEVAAQALHAGADDYGSTMMEENVVSRAGALHRSQAEADIQARIRAAGFRPAKRDTRYRIIAEYAPPACAAAAR